MFDTKILYKDYKEKIYLYGYVYVVKTTTTEEIINKYKFYIKSNNEKYELDVISFDKENNNNISEVRIQKVDSFHIPTDKYAKKIRYYSYVDNEIHFSLENQNEMEKESKYKEINHIKKILSSKNPKIMFLLCEAFGIKLLDQITEKITIKNLLDDESKYGILYINEKNFYITNRTSMKEKLENWKEQEYFNNSKRVIELEKLIECMPFIKTKST